MAVQVGRWAAAGETSAAVGAPVSQSRPAGRLSLEAAYFQGQEDLGLDQLDQGAHHLVCCCLPALREGKLDSPAGCNVSSGQLSAWRRSSAALCMSCRPGKMSCGSGRSSWSDSGGGCIGAPPVLEVAAAAVPCLGVDTCVRAVEGPVAAGSVSSSLDLLSEVDQGGHQEHRHLQETSGTWLQARQAFQG